MSIRLKLTLWYSVLLTVILLAFGIAIYTLVQYFAYNNVRAQIEQQVKTIDIRSMIDIFERLRFGVNPNTIQSEELYIQLYNYQTGQLQQTANLNNIDLPFPDKPANVKEGWVNTTIQGASFLMYQQPLVINGEMMGLLQVAAYTEREERLLDSLRMILTFSSLAFVLFAFTIGYYLARKALQPIENVIQTTNQIRNGANLSVRIPRQKPNDEMGRLTDTLNGMLTRIERTYNDLDDAYKAQRRFVSDASHELRTPLTTIRGNIELLEKMWTPRLASDLEALSDSSEVKLDASQAHMSLEAMRDISDEAKRMTRLVSDMLSLARADAGYVMDKQPVVLLPLVEEVARRAQLLPRSVDLIIADLSMLDGATVQGNSDYLRQLVFIFIENAFKYTEQGHVELRAVRMGQQAGLIISDTGIGMSKEEIPHIFERFYRADVSRGKTAGTGLGLSIAKWIIDQHSGSIEVTTREGQGTTFIVWLPADFSDANRLEYNEDSEAET